MSEEETEIGEERGQGRVGQKRHRGSSGQCGRCRPPQRQQQGFLPLRLFRTDSLSDSCPRHRSHHSMPEQWEATGRRR